MSSDSSKGNQEILGCSLKLYSISQVMRAVYGEIQDLKNSDDGFGKASDFSKTIIDKLIKQGYDDALAK